MGMLLCLVLKNHLWLPIFLSTHAQNVGKSCLLCLQKVPAFLLLLLQLPPGLSHVLLHLEYWSLFSQGCPFCSLFSLSNQGDLLNISQTLSLPAQNPPAGSHLTPVKARVLTVASQACVVWPLMTTVSSVPPSARTGFLVAPWTPRHAVSWGSLLGSFLSQLYSSFRHESTWLIPSPPSHFCLTINLLFLSTSNLFSTFFFFHSTYHLSTSKII